ncbi:transposase [uncultured Paludibacter sp.]|uniref:Transposase n=1 Tax=uncultured Paludibacter sp. TaxID=497635 RepID=A0A653A971_9BACT|nr:transposase [uncultured Paludibacter sp.]VBB44292.1 transposase [uncultured Paludibacter sp.]VBB44636.1 transposase [uncultured Paludibacter sp.]VBB44716.1 transposase [uncultured Paludibacter sp.]
MENRNSSHTVSNLSVHIVWITKYRYHVLRGDIQSRCRDLIIQTCNSENVKILKGVVSKDHVHIHVEYPPSLSISVLVKKLKGRTSHLLQQEYPELKKRYWGQHFWSVGYGAWSIGRITDEMVQEYLDHHKDKPNTPTDGWILE